MLQLTCKCNSPQTTIIYLIETFFVMILISLLGSFLLLLWSVIINTNYFSVFCVAFRYSFLDFKVMLYSSLLYNTVVMFYAIWPTKVNKKINSYFVNNYYELWCPFVLDKLIQSLRFTVLLKRMVRINKSRLNNILNRSVANFYK